MKHQERVLVVDDEPSARKVLSRVLTNAGFYVAESGSGLAALARLVNMKFEVVTVDLRMPAMNGLELLEKIRERHPDIAVVIVTAVDDAATAVDCMKKGASDYLIKPFNMKTIIHVVQRALEKREREIAQKERAIDVEYTLRRLSVGSDFAKEDFLKLVEQEIRTPLTAVIASSESLLDAIHLANEQQVRTLTGNIRRGAWDLNDSLTHLMKHARECKGNPPPARTDTTSHQQPGPAPPGTVLPLK